jgi:hypothetical protein
MDFLRLRLLLFRPPTLHPIPFLLRPLKQRIAMSYCTNQCPAVGKIKAPQIRAYDNLFIARFTGLSGVVVYLFPALQSEKHSKPRVYECGGNHLILST